MTNLGMKVKVIFTNGITQIYRNVTEVHYNYESVLGKRTAFESDIHSTGTTVYTETISEMEVRPETELANDF